MEFGNLENLYYFIIPISILIIMGRGIKKKNIVLNILKLKSEKIVGVIKLILIVVGSILITISLLSPQKLLRNEKIKTKSNNIYILVDVSLSMLTEDVYPNRLDRGKEAIENIISNLSGDRVGIIPFSENAYIQMPLTEDYKIGNYYVDAIDSDLISGGGTNILEGLKIANSSFEKINAENKIVLILSDGGDKDQETLDFIKENNIKVYSVGVGTARGGVITPSGRKEFVKDEAGNIVVSRLNSNFLQEMATESNGNYYILNNLQDNTINFTQDMKTLKKEDEIEEETKIYRKYYQIFLGLGLLLVLIGYFFSKKVKDDE